MIKLLIIDDEPRTRRKLETIISQSTFSVEIAGIASNGSEGLEKARLLRPDIIITDVRMPQMDGIRLSTEVRKLLPDCQIIFISGYSDKDYLRSAISLKAVRYVEKPFEPEELLEAIRSAMDIIEDNRQKINILQQNQQLYQEQRNILGEKIALELLSPRARIDYMEKLYTLYPDFTSKACFYTVICQLNYIKNMELSSQEALIRIRMLLRNCFSQTLSAHKEQNIFILHLCNNTTELDTSDFNMIDILFREMKQEFSEIAEVFFAVGTFVTKPELLFQSYMEAVICRKNLFFLGYNNICYFSETDTTIGQTFHPEETLYESFDTALKKDNCKEATSLVTRFFYKIREPKLHLESNSIKNVYYRLLLTLDSVCRDRGITSVFHYDSDFIWESITRKDTLFELQNYMMHKLSLYSATVAGKSDTSVLVSRILQYIDTHYGEADLSINKMADQLHFTPAYLCQVFKNELNTTINTYISSFRIKKAVELLKQNDLKLYEISDQVGYSDPNYFSRHFKKQTGMSPSEFREKYFL